MSPQRPMSTTIGTAARSSLSPPDTISRSRGGGRTPPPAPSAAYARRAREIMEDEGMSLSMSPAGKLAPALSVSDLGGEEVGPGESEGEVEGGGFAAGFRRARAGIMPSRFQGAEESGTSNPSTPESYIRTSALSPAYPNASTPTRPSLRHTASSSAGLPTLTDKSPGTAVPSSATSNRPRSGSLGLPQNALGSAFGNSPFSKSWLANPGPARSPLGRTGDGSGNEEKYDPMASYEAYSPSDPDPTLAGSGALSFSTLDYLGLAEGGGNEQLSLAPASMAEVRTQAQKAIAQNGPTSRLRASTVSNFARPLRASATDGYTGEEEQQYANEASLAGAMETLAVYDANTGYDGMESTYGYKEAHRPRAITVGTLDNPRRRNNGYPGSGSVGPSPLGGGAGGGGGHQVHPYFYSNVYGMPGGGGGGGRGSRSRDSSVSRGPRMGMNMSMSMSSHTSRAGTPDFERMMGMGGMNPQVPTRSLWIGNLDVDATSDTLLQVFAQYGPIESVRMLPEKTCAFVNYLEKTDAIRARDDVLNRLGGHIAPLSETAPVRIGFGKIDSAPLSLTSSTIAPAPPGLVFTTGNIAAAAAAAAAGPPLHPGMMSPDQSTEQSSMPTRALWIGSIPATTSSATLLQIFSPFGPVESARVLMHKCCGFINFERLDSAVSARNALNGRDILGSDVGPIRIGYARVPTKTPVIGGPEDDDSITKSPERFGEALNTVQGAVSVPTEQQLSAEGGGVENYRSPLVIDLIKAGVHEQVLEKGLATRGSVSEEQMIMQVLSAGRADEDADVKAAAAAEARPMGMYYAAIPGIGDRPMKRFDAPRLKEYRKRLESGPMSQDEVDGLALELLEDSAELAADHIGNTVIQKLFERVSYTIRVAMLERIAPHLAMVGVHKNGTWAAQKIIECSVTEPERLMITQHLRAFAPPLMCDSLGNYVCAGTLRFGPPYSDYVFDAMVDRMWDIAQNRFGARCMRTCLESPFTSMFQKKRISAGVILNAIPLATNPNGALLLTWLVDQSNLPGRYGLLANRFAPHIAHLCTHKLASLTVLRSEFSADERISMIRQLRLVVISQTSEPSASAALLAATFTSPNDHTLIEILSDANNGAQIIGKILATNTIPSDERENMVSTVRRVLPGIKASNTPPYRLLLEAVGLPIPSGTMNVSSTSPYARPAVPKGPSAWQGGGRYSGTGGYNSMYQPNSALGALGYAGNSSLNPLSIHQAQGGGSPGMNGGASPRTPVPHHRGRLSPASQMMSPGSDPFNPFASPSIDVPYLQAHGQVRLTNGMPAMQFEQQPNIGGLGFMGPSQGVYQHTMMYGRSGYQG